MFSFFGKQSAESSGLRKDYQNRFLVCSRQPEEQAVLLSCEAFS